MAPRLGLLLALLLAGAISAQQQQFMEYMERRFGALEVSASLCISPPCCRGAGPGLAQAFPQPAAFAAWFSAQSMLFYLHLKQS